MIFMHLSLLTRSHIPALFRWHHADYYAGIPNLAIWFQLKRILIIMYETNMYELLHILLSCYLENDLTGVSAMEFLCWNKCIQPFKQCTNELMMSYSSSDICFQNYIHLQLFACPMTCVPEVDTYPPDTRRNNNVIITSKRRRDVVLT